MLSSKSKSGRPSPEAQKRIEIQPDGHGEILINRVLQGATKGAESGRQIPWGLGENHGKTDGKWGKKHGKLPEFDRFSWLR